MNKISEHQFNKELQLVLTYFSNHIQGAKTKKKAEEEIEFAAYMLGLVVNKYYEK